MTSTYETDKRGRLVIDRDPNSILDYSADFTEWLTQSADTIASVDAVVEGVTLAAGRPGPAFVGGLVTVWIAGGVIGAETLPSLTFRVTTVAGRVDDRTVYFKMKTL